jgi:hypothetical protein
MNESGRPHLGLLGEEADEIVTAKVVDGACRDKQRRRVFELRRVGDDELASEPLFTRETRREVNERSVVVAADKLDVVAEPGLCSKPSKHVAKPASDIDDPVRRPHALCPQRSEHREDEALHAVALLKFFGKPLQFEMGANEHAVDVPGVENPSAMRPPRDNPSSACHSVSRKLAQHLVKQNLTTCERLGVVRNDEIRKLWTMKRHDVANAFRKPGR